MSEILNLDAIEPWLAVCGGCDAGIGMCTHPAGDYRPVLLRLVREVERLRERLDAQIHTTELAEAEMSALVAAELAALPHEEET